MEAIRRAEQQQRAAAGQQNSAVPGTLALEPLADRSGRLEDLDAQFPADTRPAAPQAPRHDPGAAARDAARNLFAVKQPATTDWPRVARVSALLTLMTIAGSVAYFFWQQNAQAQTQIQIQPTPALARSNPAPTPSAAPSTQTAVPPAPTFTATAAVLPPTRAIAAVAKPSMTPSVPGPAPAAAIRVTTTPQPINPLQQQAYAAFNNGELAVAQTAWLTQLQSEPHNSDVLHGLAAIALQRQQADRAAAYYRRALDADPKDALALSGLITLSEQSDPQQTESRLKNLLAEQAESPFLNFALGNLYARTARWSDAQQAYFKAHGADPDNPDYLFNLAVSLDQLRQPRLAAQHYRRALDAIAQRPAGFDPAQVTARLKVLQQPLQQPPQP